MATITAFTPTATSIFSFGAVLDGGTYTCTVTWNLYRIGWYLNIYDATGNLIVARALIAAPPNPPSAMNMVFGYFTTSTMFFDDATQSFVVSP